MTVTAAPPTAAHLLRGSEPLPLPTLGWGPVEAQAAVAEARLVLDIPEATVVSALTTVVLRAGELAVKVYPPGTDPEHLWAITAALAGSDTAVLLERAPIVTSYGVVAISRWLADGKPVSWPRLGRLLRRFHAEAATANLPPWVPLRRLPPLVAGLMPDHAQVLLNARDVLLDALAGVGSVVGDGLIHGDVSPSNVLAGPYGSQFIDLDFAARGPREYDLASAARRLLSGEIDARTYRKFCRRYGFDVREWDGLPLVDRIADLGGVAFRLWDSRHHGRDLSWVEDAVATWRTPL
ncbi:MAG TPA: phosphotransferase [Propionibacteriaceae bacterium]|nr:phosphotransferase [Propionibacteriaceae bacterium]